MSDQPLSEPIRELLSDHVESISESGDFEAMWRGQLEPSRRSMWPTLALAAAAILVIGLAAKQALFVAEAPQEASAASPWFEPYPLRFPVAPPAPAAAEAVRAMMAEPTESKLFEAAVEASGPKDRPNLLLRRALVGINLQDLDMVSDSGRASMTPIGTLLVAEVHQVDLEADEARSLFIEVDRSGDPIAAPIAQGYLKLIDSGRLPLHGLADVRAMFLLGDKKMACRSLPEITADFSPKDRRLAHENAPELAACEAKGW